MELPAAGEHVFAVEGIEKKRIRKVNGRVRFFFCRGEKRHTYYYNGAFKTRGGMLFFSLNAGED